MKNQGWWRIAVYVTFNWSYIDKLLLVLFRHLSQTVVFAWEISFKSRQSLDDHSLHLTSFSACAGRWQAEATDTAASAHTGWQHIFVIKNPRGDLHQTAILCITLRIQNSLSNWRNDLFSLKTERRIFYLWTIKICWVLHGLGVIAIVPVLDDWVKKVSEHLRITTLFINTGQK